MCEALVTVVVLVIVVVTMEVFVVGYDEEIRRRRRRKSNKRVKNEFYYLSMHVLVLALIANTWYYPKKRFLLPICLLGSQKGSTVLEYQKFCSL